MKHRAGWIAEWSSNQWVSVHQGSVETRDTHERATKLCELPAGLRQLSRKRELSRKLRVNLDSQSDTPHFWRKYSRRCHPTTKSFSEVSSITKTPIFQKKMSQPWSVPLNKLVRHHTLTGRQSPKGKLCLFLDKSSKDPQWSYDEVMPAVMTQSCLFEMEETGGFVGDMKNAEIFPRLADVKKHDLMWSLEFIPRIGFQRSPAK